MPESTRIKLRNLAPMLFLIAQLWSCTPGHEAMLKEFEMLKEKNQEIYPLIFAYATYLGTSESILPKEALPLVLEMISHTYYTEARYSIDNLERKGIHSPDLLALRGLCYFNELQPDLALSDLKLALKRDPDNAKIKGVLATIQGGSSPAGSSGQEAIHPILEAAALIKAGEYGRAEGMLNAVLDTNNTQHEALFYKGLIRLQHANYDSAQHYFAFAASSEGRDSYREYARRCRQVMEAERTIASNPGNYAAYLAKGQHLSAMGLVEQAQRSLDEGLEANPGNMNLILAKALAWVQAGQPERARTYLDDLERRGLQIDPALRQQILTQSSSNS